MNKNCSATPPIALSLPSARYDSLVTTPGLICGNHNPPKISRDYNQTLSSSSGLVLTSTSRNYDTDLWASLIPSSWKYCRLASDRPPQTHPTVRSATKHHRPPRMLVASALRNGCPCVRDPYRRKNRLSFDQRFACAQLQLDMVSARLTPRRRVAAPLILNSCGGDGAPSRARPCR